MPELIPNQNLGAHFVQNFSSGLGEGLRALSEHKLQEVLKQKETQQSAQFWKSLGLDDQTSYAFASTPKEVQKSLLDRLEGLSFGENANQSQQAPLLGEQTLGQQSQQQLSQSLPNPDQLLQQQASKDQQEKGKITLGANPLERRHRETLAQQKELAQEKATKDVRHEIVQKARAAKQDLRDLDRLEELQNTGKLDTPGYTEFLNKAGLDIQALKSPESEEFQKIQANFLRNAKQYFGGRISNFEVESFLKTIPSLSNSNEGRKRVIANLKNISRGAVEYNEAMKEVIAENKGVPPFDLEERIEDKIDKRMEKISEQFKKDLAKSVPKEQNRLITALQTGAGKVAGNLGKGLLGAGLGAAGGSRLGPQGALAGGVAGGLAGLAGASVKDFI